MPPRFTQAELSLMVSLFFEEGRNASRVATIFRQLHPQLRVDYRVILRTVRRFSRSGNVSIRQPPGRPPSFRSYAYDLDILLFQIENPHSSLCQTARLTGSSRETVRRILRTYNLKPFRSHVVHGQRGGDEERRVNFLAHVKNLLEEIQNFLSVIMWTDESTFTNNGLFNRWNFRTWATENPRLSYSTRHQVRYTVNVWCGLMGNQLIGPYFLDGGSLNGERYLQFCQEVLPGLLENVPLATRQAMWFQHDGCPAHNTLAVSRHLDAQFGTRWIGNRSRIAWPARSPDLTPLDYFLWGQLKTKVYSYRCSGR